jgi:hypothetical protein
MGEVSGCRVNTVYFRSAAQCLALLLFVDLAVAPAQAGDDLSGTWKARCGDHFGLLIEKADRDVYAVIFCGLRACSRSWTPNTKIKGDPKYEIMSRDELGIRKGSSKSFFFFHRCPDDPALRNRLSSASAI